MKRVKVLIPFTDKVTGELRNIDDEIEMTDERIAEVRAVGVNMISVLGDVGEVTKEVEPTPKKKTTRKKKAE